MFQLAFYNECARTTSCLCHTINIWWPFQVKLPNLRETAAIPADIWHIFSSVPAVWSYPSLFSLSPLKQSCIGQRSLAWMQWLLRATCKFTAKPARLCRNGPEAALTELGCSGRWRTENGEVSGWQRALSLIRDSAYTAGETPTSLSELACPWLAQPDSQRSQTWFWKGGNQTKYGSVGTSFN